MIEIRAKEKHIPVQENKDQNGFFQGCANAFILYGSALKTCAHVFFPLTEEEEDSDSGSEVDVKKAGRRHKLLRKKLTLSEGESDNDKPAKSNKEAKRRGRRKGQS